MAERTPFLQKSLHSGRLQLSSPLRESIGSSNPRGEEVFNWVISSNLLHLNDLTYLPLFIAPLEVAPPLTFSLLSPLLPFPAPGRWFRTWVLTPTNSFTCPSLSPVFCPNRRSPYFNFLKACSDDYAFYFYSHCPSAEEFSSFFFSSAALFTSLALKAAKSSIPFECIKCHPKAWWSAKVKEAVSERHKAFAAAQRSDEDR